MAAAAAKKKVPIKARVLYDYRKAADDELSLTVNDIVTILDKHLDDEGWWKVNTRAKDVCQCAAIPSVGRTQWTRGHLSG